MGQLVHFFFLQTHLSREPLQFISYNAGISLGVATHISERMSVFRPLKEHLVLILSF